MTPRDRRALILGGAIVVPVLLTTWGMRPLVGRFQSLRAEVARERDLMIRERDLLAAVPALDSAAAALEQHLDGASDRLFPGSDPLAASAGLSTYLSELAGRHRVLVLQGETRPPVAAAGDLVAVEVGLRAQSDLEGVLALLTALERGARLVEVTRLAIERTAPPREREPEQETLSLTLIVRGYAGATPSPSVVESRQ
jgi:hypothetical protein